MKSGKLIVEEARQKINTVVKSPVEGLVSTENPFYRNYVFNEADLCRAIIKWWHYPILWFRPTYVQVTDGHAFHFKTTADGRIWIVKMEEC